MKCIKVINAKPDPDDSSEIKYIICDKKAAYVISGSSSCEVHAMDIIKSRYSKVLSRIEEGL